MQEGSRINGPANASVLRNLPQGYRGYQGQSALATGLNDETRFFDEMYPGIIDAQPAEDIRFSNLKILVMEYITSINKPYRDRAREKITSRKCLL